MDCSCIKKFYYAIIKPINKDLFVYMDASVWMDPNATGTYPLKISATSTDKTIDIRVPKDGDIKITASMFGTPCIEDDIYCFTATTCGEKFSVYRFVDGNIKMVIDDLLAKGDPSYLDIKILSERVKIAAERGDVESAVLLYNVLKNKLKGIECASCPELKTDLWH